MAGTGRREHRARWRRRMGTRPRRQKPHLSKRRLPLTRRWFRAPDPSVGSPARWTALVVSGHPFLQQVPYARGRPLFRPGHFGKHGGVSPAFPRFPDEGRIAVLQDRRV